MGVYQIELNGKTYVGSSSRSIEGRWNSHLDALRKGNHCNQYLQNAFNKYGEELLKFSVLEVVEIPEDCIIIEQKYIDSINPEYNICPTAGSSLGMKHTEEAIQKMRDRIVSKETRQKMRDRIVSEETRQKNRLAQLETHHTEETKQKMRLASTGKHHTEESKQKCRLVNLGRHHTEEARQNNRLAQLGTHHPHTEETKQKIRLARLGTHHTEESRQKNRLASLGNTNTLGTHHTEEAKAKMKDSWARRKETLK